MATDESRELRKKAEAYSTQAKRIAHTADRTRLSITSAATREQTIEYERHNSLTMVAIARNFVDRSDEEETAWQERIEGISAGEVLPAAFACTLTRAQQWYEGKAKATTAQAIQALIKITTEKMQSNSKGIKAMSCALNPKPSRPLMHAKRDRTGSAGQQVGTVTTDPCEVDSIAIRAWKNIYDGNVADLVDSVRIFKEMPIFYIMHQSTN